MAAAAAPPPGSKLSYNPEPFEQAYYSGLFATADVERTGKIGGAQAVQFFQRSKLPIDALKNIWIVADQPPTNFLDPPKFAVCVRLIQCIQNGQKGTGTNLLSPPGITMRPAMFEGVSGVAVPLPGGGGPPPGQQPPPQHPQQPQQQPPPQQQQQQPQPMNGSSRALAVQDPYTLSATDQARFEEMFPNYARDGYVHGSEAVALFSKSGMPQAQLAAIWNMVDSPVDNRLDKLEFAMAMHLIVCVSKRNLPMPPSLPASLQQLKTSQQQQQHSAPPTAQGPPPQPLQRPMGQQQQQPPPSPPRQQPRMERSPTYDSSYGVGASVPSAAGMMPPPQQQQPGMMMQRGQASPSPQIKPLVGFGMPGGGGGPPQMQMQQPQAGFGMQGGPPRPQMQMQQQQPGMYGGGGGSVGGGSLQGSPKPLQGSLPPLSFSMQQSTLQQPQLYTTPSSPGGGGIPSPMAQPLGGFGMQQQQPAVQYGGFPQQQREMPAPPLHQYQGRVSPAMSTQTEPALPSMPQQQQQQHHHHHSEINVSSISDAFEGLDTGAVDEKSYVSAPPVYERNQQFQQQQQQQQHDHQNGGIPEPESVASTPEKASGGMAAPVTHESFKSSHRGPFEDTQKLKSTLQKLQAENISLKAQLGSMTEEEREAQEELSKTVAEIGVLSNQLTTLRAQVLAAKSRLLETTAELKASHEKKSVMTDLIAEAEATRIAIDEATAGVESTITIASKRAASPPPEEDLFSFGPTPGQPTLSQAPAARSDHDEHHIPTPDPVDPAEKSMELSTPVRFAPTVETPSRQEPSNSYGNNFGQASRPAAIHNADRGFSTGSNFGFGPDAIMGAGSLPTPGPSFAFSAAESHDRAAGSESFDDVIMSVPSVGEIDALKMKAKEAEDIARDAEESSRQALAQVNELRRLADEAEKEARKLSAEDDGKKKKKGFLGRGGGTKKKADAKEAERLNQDANAKKQQFLQAQSQANDAQALAKATKREAEKLRSEAEEAEIQAASAASMHQQQQDQEKHEHAQRQQYHSAPSNGYANSGDYGAPGYSYGQQPFGGENSAYDPHVMGNGGGIEIPAPSGDPYDNPFGV